MHIEHDDLSRRSVIDLLRFHTRDMADHSPDGTSYALDLTALRASDITLYTAWEDEQLLGCVALHELDSVSGEIKSMRTAHGYTRRGVGQTLLRHVAAVARKRGYARLSLETGTTPLFHTAIAFYAAHGFVLGEQFSNYVPSRYNIFMHLDL